MTTADPATADAPAEVSVDAFLGGRVEAVQPAKGHHRSGLEAVLLAASLDARISGTVVDLGAGVGAAGLCAAARCRHARVVLVERDGTAIAAARAALGRPANAGFADRVRLVAADISGSEADRSEAGIGRGLADHVIVNPPFYGPGSGTASPKAARAGAHVLGPGGLDPWFRAAASVLKFRGDLTIVFRADGLDAVLAAAARRFGGLDILPVHPRAGEPAHRVLVRGVKGSRAALRLLPPLVLHEGEGSGFAPAVEAILREGRALSTVVRAWHGGRGRPS
ncbi:MAG TPA: methyltransferase [Bauldia sp.]|nr:methyltransferase [Bauldia sp.]